MEAETSKKPVGGGFNLKALILNKLKKEKARPVENQLETSKREVTSQAVVVELSDLEAFRQASPKEPPMIAPGMPDYAAFCAGYWRECDHCPHYVNTDTGLFCSMWEAVFPGKVRWYPPSY